MIEREMLEEEGKEEVNTAEINRYYIYTNLLVQFEDTMEGCTKNHIEFWTLMLDRNPDIRSVEQMGTKVTLSKE